MGVQSRLLRHTGKPISFFFTTSKPTSDRCTDGQPPENDIITTLLARLYGHLNKYNLSRNSNGDIPKSKHKTYIYAWLRNNHPPPHSDRSTRTITSRNKKVFAQRKSHKNSADMARQSNALPENRYQFFFYDSSTYTCIVR